MSSMTVSFYSQKHYQNSTEAIKSRATVSIEICCNPSLNKLMAISEAICTCAGIEPSVGIIVDDALTEDISEGESICVAFYNHNKYKTADAAIQADAIRRVNLDFSLTLNDLHMIIGAVSRCAAIDNVIGIAFPTATVIDIGHSGQSMDQKSMLHS
ncbi:hypothetical protein ABLV51_19290 [Klebsiella sp. GB_Kp051]|uniref:hypothetical protein n=1 Tax=Klebsiella/Raoultella group TaxID=2890311 RepID=UPI000849FFBF|nr:MULTISPECIES: hypothetical protein [Klebsiella/Raoultella group]AOO59908.1 hypothetical protein AN237_25540 [Raoultella ornithinolytica]EIV6184300.1 hypothetical protein [Klebsiella aerogenes]SMG72956.1 Uncharacterised protein [Klebsiella quasipneumoniae]